MFLIALLYLLFALTFTLAKAVLLYCKPLMFIGLRMTLAGGVLLTALGLSGKLRYERGSWWLLMQSVLFHVFFAYTAEFWALQYISSSKTALIYNISPFVTALLSIIILKEAITRLQWLGLAVGFIGMVPVFTSFDACQQFIDLRILSLSELVLVAAVISSCYGWIIMRQLLERFNYTPLHVNGISMALGGILSLAVSAAVESRPLFFERTLTQGCLTDVLAPFGWDGALWLGVYGVSLIVIANVVCYNLYGYLLSRYSATFISLAGFLCPIFASLLGWIYLGESISLSLVAGFIAVVIGLLLFYWGRSEKGH